MELMTFVVLTICIYLYSNYIPKHDKFEALS